MTCEEAIKTIQIAKAEVEWNYPMDYAIAFDKAIEALQEPKWILVSERMPEEHESMFAKFKGTNKWHKGMFEKVSDDVNVTVEFTDGTRKVMTMYTTDGEWHKDIFAVKYEIIAWMPFPEPYKEREQ